ncbi:MAG: FtsX-like permease family protein [Candidatus Taylorbacteria bacterium]|nr:FtsX-like permease family protein [Candidatus Taylorbacteria bacterium]
MKLTHHFKNAVTGLKTNKTRSFLTIFGIVIGITSIILVMSLGAGAQNFILSQVQGLGSKTVAVVPGRQPKGPSDSAQLFSDSLREKDLVALQRKSNVPNLSKVMPIVFGGETGLYENNTYRLTVFGGTELISSIFDLVPEAGQFFTEDDTRSRANVVVIGSKVKDELFGASDAVGQKIRIKNLNLRVVGVLPKKGQVSFFNFDEIAIIPYTTAQEYIFGIKYFHRMIVEADTDKNIDQVAEDVRITLRNSHDITDPDKDDFFVQTQADLANRLGTITTALTLFLVAMASISLFVGGVGIMNIMLVSVTERTKEIGLRKSIGATNQDILTQFLIEAVVLTSIGGIVGIIIGTGLAFLIGQILINFAAISWPFNFPWTGAILGLFVSATIGLVFGIYPAKHAASKSPMEALRYE